MTRLVAAVALLIVAVFGVRSSGAAFTDRLDEQTSSAGAGTLTLDVSRPGEAPVDARFMRPGQERLATVDLVNSGSVPAQLSVAVGTLTDTPSAAGLSKVLRLKVERCSATACDDAATLYDGALDGFSQAQLGSVSAAGRRVVRLHVSWPRTEADPARQGAGTATSFTFTAVAGSTK